MTRLAAIEELAGVDVPASQVDQGCTSGHHGAVR
jgi:hypothetical protein